MRIHSGKRESPPAQIQAGYGVFRDQVRAQDVELLHSKESSRESRSSSESISDSSSDSDEPLSLDVEEFKSERPLPKIEHFPPHEELSHKQFGV
jgi:hypothetical protein